MWGKALFLAGLSAALVVAAGCHHDKHDVSFKPKEECVLPSSEPRFDNPPSAEYRKRPVKVEDKSLMNRGMGGPGGGLNPGF